MKLLTKQKCSSCDTVKQFLIDAKISGIQIIDCTNDLVSRQRMSDAGIMTFPALEKPDGAFIIPSDAIIQYLADRENSKASNNLL